MKPPYGKVDPYPQRHGRGSRPRRANLNSCLLLINCLSRLAHCDESTTAVVRTGVLVRCCQSLCIQRTGETASFFQHSSTQEQQSLAGSNQTLDPTIFFSSAAAFSPNGGPASVLSTLRIPVTPLITITLYSLCRNLFFQM